mmetsp:Transcript_3462/g.10532  ORF Transcript_3462/g.10532 Transcript_3462/m.10532 type:complete len:313 (-) Transcript_3462:76-1014(-)
MPPSMRHLVLALGCLALCCSGEGDEDLVRNLPDDAVLASQRYYSTSWRKHYEDGEPDLCGKAYLENAALHISLGPGAAELTTLTGWKDGMVVRGRTDITRFWSKAVESVGKGYDGDTEQGDYASTRFVVDDDTVLISGAVLLGGARGRKVSQTWVRQGAEWRIKSEMLDIQDFEPPKSEAAPKADISGEISKIVEIAEKVEKHDKVTKEALALGKGIAAAFGGQVKKVSEEVPKAVEAETKGAEPKAKAEAAAKPAAAEQAAAVAPPAAQSSIGFWPILATVLVIGGVATFLVRKTRRRQEATIAGFEAMLG